MLTRSLPLQALASRTAPRHVFASQSDSKVYSRRKHDPNSACLDSAQRHALNLPGRFGSSKRCTASGTSSRGCKFLTKSLTMGPSYVRLAANTPSETAGALVLVLATCVSNSWALMKEGASICVGILPLATGVSDAPAAAMRPCGASLAARLGTDPSQAPSRGIQSPRGAAADRGLRRRRLWRPARACGKRADFGLSSLHVPMWEPAEFCWGP